MFQTTNQDSFDGEQIIKNLPSSPDPLDPPKKSLDLGGTASSVFQHGGSVLVVTG